MEIRKAWLELGGKSGRLGKLISPERRVHFGNGAEYAELAFFEYGTIIRSNVAENPQSTARNRARLGQIRTSTYRAVLYAESGRLHYHLAGVAAEDFYQLAIVKGSYIDLARRVGVSKGQALQYEEIGSIIPGQLALVSAQTCKRGSRLPVLSRVVATECSGFTLGVPFRS
jgi:hypothetical protein